MFLCRARMNRRKRRAKERARLAILGSLLSSSPQREGGRRCWPSTLAISRRLTTFFYLSFSLSTTQLRSVSPSILSADFSRLGQQVRKKNQRAITSMKNS